ncbi:MAG: hypothetical protein CVV64_00085 [Candidatus Wallbacteria bacterium HGW-Wallbacteria-1]|jgi:ubiquinone/menaquinone biosynthesis C-methylase UbiE|uniref:Methyltransferase type 11 domain-containing protein n=1 Tax=Candidatus Wallbacteria bacterium HGW-Wallbacteria-1 TaxID=2013854 RepID=A0A2N1PUA0_9BACT|nr:MAG: hypothetical protein CVV64_00085 [Candidatus Wallbacteria bacterium HGW-Wallbacteria-1]
MSFDGFAPKYDKYNKLHFGEEYDAFREKTVLGGEIVPEDTILEFGCGTSLCLEHILKTRPFKGIYIGLDLSSAMLETARTKFMISGQQCRDELKTSDSADSPFINDQTNPKILHIQIGRSGKLPIRDDSIDVIISSLVLHLLSRERRDELFAEFRRVLKPGGRICLNEFGKPGNLRGRIYRFYVLYFWSLFVRDEKNSRDLFDGCLLTEMKNFFQNASIRERTREIIDHLVATATRD